MVRPEFTNIPVLNVLPDIPQIYNNTPGFSFTLDAIILSTLFATLFAPLGKMMFQKRGTETAPGTGTMGQRFGAILGVIFGISSAFALSGAGLTLFGFWVTALLAALFFSFALYKIMLNIFGEKAKVLAGIIAFIIAWVLMDAYLVTTDLEIVRNIFGFLSLLAPMIFAVAVIYLIQKKWRGDRGTTERETRRRRRPGDRPSRGLIGGIGSDIASGWREGGLVGALGRGFLSPFTRTFLGRGPIPRTPQEEADIQAAAAHRTGQQLEQAVADAETAQKDLEDIVPAAENKAVSHTETGELVGTARTLIKKARDAAKTASKKLAKLPAEFQARATARAEVARAAASRAEAAFSRIETAAAQKYLAYGQEAMKLAQSLHGFAELRAADVTRPNTPLEVAQPAAARARGAADQAQVAAGTAQKVVSVMKAVTPRNKTELDIAKDTAKRAKTEADEAEVAAKRAEDALKKMAPTEGIEIVKKKHWWQRKPKPAGDDDGFRIIEIIEEGTAEAGDAAAVTKKGEKDLGKIADEEGGITKGLDGADADVAKTLGEGSTLAAQTMTKSQLVLFYTAVRGRLGQIDRVFVEIRNLTKNHARKFEKNDYKTSVDKVTQAVRKLDAEFAHQKETLKNNLRPAATTPDAQAALAIVDKEMSNMNAPLTLLNAAVKRLEQGHVEQYARMRTECLLNLDKIQKREKLTPQYTSAARSAVQQLEEQSENEEIKRGETDKIISDINNQFDLLHKEITKTYMPSHKLISDYIKAYKGVIDSIRQDIEVCEKNFNEIKKPAKALLDAIQALKKIIEQPPPTAPPPLPTPAPVGPQPVVKGRKPMV